MKPPIKYGLLGGLAMALLGALGTKASDHQSATVAIGTDGRITIQSGAAAQPKTLILSKRTACQAIGKTPSTTEVVVRSDPDAAYETFGRTLNWLEDCGVYDLRIIGLSSRGPVDVKLGVPRPGAMPAPSEPVIQPSPVFCSRTPNPGVKSVCPKGPTYVALQDNGEILVSMGEAEMKRSSLGDVAMDVARSLDSPRPTEERVFIRPDRHATYAQVIELLDRLKQGGYERIGLVAGF